MGRGTTTARLGDRDNQARTGMARLRMGTGRGTARLGPGPGPGTVRLGTGTRTGTTRLGDRDGQAENGDRDRNSQGGDRDSQGGDRDKDRDSQAGARDNPRSHRRAMAATQGLLLPPELPQAPPLGFFFPLTFFGSRSCRLMMPSRGAGVHPGLLNK